MSLIQQPTMTEKNRAAHQRNARMSHGATTAEGKERARAAHLRHGFYSQVCDEALVALGENPDDLRALIASAQREWRPAGDLAAGMASRLARLLWRMDRAERIQESVLAHRALEHQQRRRDLALHLHYKVNPRLDLLSCLLEDTADVRYYTTPSHFHWFCDAFGNPPQHPYEEQLFVLLHRLRKPRGWGQPAPGGGTEPDPAAGAVAETSDVAETGGGESSGDGQPAPQAAGSVAVGAAATAADAPSSDDGIEDDLFLRSQAELEQDDFPVPRPHVRVARGEERDELRAELQRLAKYLLDVEHQGCDPAIAEHEAPLTRIELDQVLATPHHQLELMRREEDRCFRQFARLGNLLLKHQASVMKHGELNPATQPGEEDPATRPDEEDPAMPPGPEDPVIEDPENEGSSGYVDENTNPEKTDAQTDCPDIAQSGVADTRSGVRRPGSGVAKTRSEVRSSKSKARPTQFGAANSRSKVESRRSKARPAREGSHAGAARGIADSAFRIPDHKHKAATSGE